MSFLRFTLLAAALIGCSRSNPAGAQQNPAPRTGLLTEALAGQTVAVLPLTQITRDTAIHDPGLPAARAEATVWADSLLSEVFLDRASEVNWVWPAELRRMARRAAGMVPEPDRLGHSVLRAPKLNTVPDPLRSNLRTLMALAGGRHVFVPASLSLTRDDEGAVRASLSAVLTDARLGQVIWRVDAVGSGPSAGDAIRAAVESFLARRTP